MSKNCIRCGKPERYGITLYCSGCLCRHSHTHMIVDPVEPHVGPSIEVCDDCGMSRKHTEWDSTPWMRVELPHPDQSTAM